MLGYYWVRFDEKPNGRTGLSDDAYIGVGYSTITLFSIFVAAAFLAVIPLALAMRTLKSPMPLGASNSLVISAACHVPVLEEKPAAESQTGDSNSGIATVEQQFAPVSTMEDEDNQATGDNNEPQGPHQNHGLETLEMQSLLTVDDRVSSNIGRIEDDVRSTGMLLDTARYLFDASQEPLRWGAVETPPSWNQHLSFGTRDHNVQEPVDGQWYQ